MTVPPRVGWNICISAKVEKDAHHAIFKPRPLCYRCCTAPAKLENRPEPIHCLSVLPAIKKCYPTWKLFTQYNLNSGCYPVVAITTRVKQEPPIYMDLKDETRKLKMVRILKSRREYSRIKRVYYYYQQCVSEETIQQPVFVWDGCL